MQVWAFLLLQEGGAISFDLRSMWAQMGWLARAVVFALFMLAVQLSSLVGPYPPSATVAAASGLAMYLLFAAVAGWLDRGRMPRRA